MRRAARCEFCARPSRKEMCALCGRSYDRDAHHDGSVMGAMVWAARRARYFARRAAVSARAARARRR
jgi:hypothetical protein